jgi:hypothetical protein
MSVSKKNIIIFLETKNIEHKTKYRHAHVWGSIHSILISELILPHPLS